MVKLTMNAKIMIAIFATVAMLFAGVAVADTVDAVEGGDEGAEETGPAVTPTPAPKPIQFIVDGKDYWMNNASASITLPDLKAISCTLDAKWTFAGWNIQGHVENTDACYPAGTTITHVPDTVYVAKLTVTTYTVNFVDGEVTTPVVGDLDANKVKDVPDANPADGFVFVGWFDAEGNELVIDDGKFTITGNATYTAKYAVDPTITFVVDGITIYSMNLDDLEYPTDPAKDNFKFVGWKLNTDLVADAGIGVDAGLVALKALGLDADAVLVAVFEPALHTVTFAVDGVAVSTQTVKHGELATEPAFIPAKEGFDFAGWDYVFTAPVGADITVNAKFTETVAPEPTGLDDPMTQTTMILIGILVIVIMALVVSKVKKGEPIFGMKIEKAKKNKNKNDDEGNE